MFITREIAFTTHDGLELAGELVIPQGFRDGVCVVLQQGSTLCDRDGNTPRTQSPSTLYRRIARMLAERGIASFRHDKRQWDWALPRPLTYTFEDRVGDLCAAFMATREAPELELARLALVGHSEGGLVAQAAANRLAEQHATPNSVTVLASPAGTLLESIQWRADQALSRGGQKHTKLGLAIHAVLHEYRRRMESGIDFGPEEYVTFCQWYAAQGAMNGWESWPWLKQHAALDVPTMAKSLPCPVLYLHGDHDRIVTPEALHGYRAATAHHPYIAVCELMPGLGHYLEDSTRKAFVVSERLVDRVAQWVTSPVA